MNKKDCIEKFGDLLKDVSDKSIDKMLSLLNSGSIDIDKFDNDYELPRILLVAALNDVVSEMILLPRQKREIENLSRF